MPLPDLLRLAWRDLRGGGRSLWLFVVCLALGVSLIAATGGLYRMVSGSLLGDVRSLFGGDVEVESRTPLPEEALAWMGERGDVSLLIELRTMLGGADGRFRLVELQSVDRAYPLYGRLELSPEMPVEDATGLRDGRYGAALDPVLAQRLAVGVGDSVRVGGLSVEVRALIRRQPDRALSADWRGPPVLIATAALEQSGLVQPGSRLEYEYRVRTSWDPMRWRDDFNRRFPGGDYEVQLYTGRGERMARVLDQVASGLLLIGFSALFIGGLGVFNSIQSYLQGKLATIATLRALGLRGTRLALLYLLEVGILGGGAALAGVLVGGLLAVVGSVVVAARLPMGFDAGSLLPALGVAALFGLLTAYAFALPAIGRALSVDPAVLFRGVGGARTVTPRRYVIAAGAVALLLVGVLLAALPEPVFGLGFLAVMAVTLLLLEGVVRLLRRASAALEHRPRLERHFALRLALANLHRPGSTLRATLLSLGTALTLLTACALVVAALLLAIDDTIPEQAPALVFYDISDDQREFLRDTLREFGSLRRTELAPLVLGKVEAVNGARLRDSSDPERVNEAGDEHKLSYRAGNIDGVRIVAGRWWPDYYAGLPLVAMEDREAGQLGIVPGDLLRFDILGETVEAEVAAIYSQRGIQTRFWFEAIFSAGALEPYIARHVGAAWLDDGEAVAAQDRIGAGAPNIVVVRTAAILAEARTLLGRAGAGLGVVVAVSLTASLLVLASMIATGRARLLYESTVLHSIGARLSVIRRSLQLEFAILGLVTSLFALAGGYFLAQALLVYRIRLPADDLLWVGIVAVAACSALTLGFGGRYLLRVLKLNPAMLLRRID